MKKGLCILLVFLFLLSGCSAPAEEAPANRLLFQGHASLRITTAEGKIIYIDPYAGDGYDIPADLILVTHRHEDHNNVGKIKTQNEGCEFINNSKALVKGEYKTFDLGYVTVEAVQAGNRNHDIKYCVGWLLTLPGDITVYVSGDTSTTDQMAELADRHIDYAFFCSDGIYNMDIEEAIACAELVGARHSIPYHNDPGTGLDMERAERFDAPGKLVIRPGEEIILAKE